MQHHLIILLFITGVFPIVHAVYRKYHLILNGKTWTDARTYCRSMYTDLATFETPDEITQLQNIANSQNCADSIWIGLYNDVNSWRWSMGNVPLGSFINWYPPNPDNQLAKQSCGVVNPNGWLDNSCTTLMTFICFDVITGQIQIIKLTVQFNQDVDDPAVKAAILDKIESMVRGHGATAVKWRKQLNGLVFKKIQ
ncbi:hypothetical protein HF521_015386 [Silurus meridionalis]|uniref:C-type lectin domain-containing protein n=1 Tax=Silurus meridionalis TaxID=175797 RepID=A0A8T0A7S0_SILME|nr:hypothetical protein HF521_015386 [Silurus meridionalis]